MVLNSLLISLGFVFVYMTLWFIAAWWHAKNDLADLAWGLGFAGIAWVLLLLQDTPQTVNWLLAGLVSVWGIRLFAHIYARNHGKPEDFRYAQMRLQWGSKAVLYSFLKVFMLQGLLMILVATPIWFIQSQTKPAVLWLVWAGAAVWFIGFIFESVGDWQLKQFISQPQNKGRVMTSGLWRYTRHPNYFGEVSLWWGVYLIALSMGGWWTIIGPLTISYLILKVSGIPLLEKKYQGNLEFEQYKKQTNAFFPWFVKNNNQSA